MNTKKVLLILGCSCLGLTVLIIACSIVAFFFIRANRPENNKNLDKNETNEYVLYYPKYYENSYSDTYASKEKNSLDANNLISLSEGTEHTTVNKLDSSADCDDMGDEYLKNLNIYYFGSTDEDIDQTFTSFSKSFNNVRECKFKFKSNTTKGTDMIYEFRIIEKDNDRYNLVAIYADDIEKDEKGDLLDSLNAFKVK